MRRIITILLLATSAALLSGTTSAHSGASRFERREARFHARMLRGTYRGQLTRGESRRLMARDQHVHRMVRRSMRDGWISMRERGHIHRAMRRESRVIRRLRHNGRIA